VQGLPAEESFIMFIDDSRIFALLGAARSGSAARVRDVLAKAREARGLTSEEVAALLDLSDPELLGELFSTARAVKERIYGQRLVLFAPLYVSNLCALAPTSCFKRLTTVPPTNASISGARNATTIGASRRWTAP
jgi:2-iminoacetate synthase